MNDDLGDRMKFYEGLEANRVFLPLVPIVCRIDGRSFHSFTKGMRRPYDETLSEIMVDTVKYLMEETGASMGYTQSDEITLAWHQTSTRSKIWFDGRIFKMSSQLAAQATIAFYRLICERMPKYADRMPTFDARVWQVPTRTEAANLFLWREWDAVKNSISMAAQSVCSHKELHGKNASERQEMLFKKGINWNNYPDFFKRGSYVQKRKVERPFNASEIEKLPLKHAARSNPQLTVVRSECNVLQLPPFSKIANKEEVIFEGAEPYVYTNELESQPGSIL